MNYFSIADGIHRQLEMKVHPTVYIWEALTMEKNTVGLLRI